MTKAFATLLTAVSVLAVALPAQAQTGDPVADFQNGVDPLSTTLRNFGSNMAGQYAGDPRVQQMYLQAQQQGYSGSYEHFILDQIEACWGQCTARARANANGRTQAEMEAWQRLRAAEGASGEAISGMNDSAGWNIGESGRVMQGTRTEYDPQTGRCYAVAYTPAGAAYQGEVACPN